MYELQIYGYSSVVSALTSSNQKMIAFFLVCPKYGIKRKKDGVAESKDDSCRVGLAAIKL
ncbi:hypothetical protein IQ243_25515 [Nostocales cyanobacterium LEGE 11386]|nr:hypothetical protein [Nostocales cyanobacterium LEGE 11386]